MWSSGGSFSRDSPASAESKFPLQHSPQVGQGLNFSFLGGHITLIGWEKLNDGTWKFRVLQSHPAHVPGDSGHDISVRRKLRVSESLSGAAADRILLCPLTTTSLAFQLFSQLLNKQVKQMLKQILIYPDTSHTLKTSPHRERKESSYYI